MKSRTEPALRSLPAAQVQISLPGYLCRAFCATCATPCCGLCLDAGQQVLSALMKADRVTLCGPKGVPDAGRRAVRGNSTARQIELGCQRIAVRRPRARSRGMANWPCPASSGQPAKIHWMPPRLTQHAF